MCKGWDRVGDRMCSCSPMPTGCRGDRQARGDRGVKVVTGQELWEQKGSCMWPPMRPQRVAVEGTVVQDGGQD